MTALLWVLYFTIGIFVGLGHYLVCKILELRGKLPDVWYHRPPCFIECLLIVLWPLLIPVIFLVTASYALDKLAIKINNLIGE
mgnify:CR=1 FL=1